MKEVHGPVASRRWVAMIDITKIYQDCICLSSTSRTRRTNLPCHETDLVNEMWAEMMDATSRPMHLLADAQLTSPLSPCHAYCGSMYLCRGASDRENELGTLSRLTEYSFLGAILVFAYVRHYLCCVGQSDNWDCVVLQHTIA